MFEKEAEEIAKRKISNFIPQQWGVSLIRTEPTWETVEGAQHFYLNSLAKMWQEGAEFGYSKANEWHYPSKGEYPKGEKNFQNYVVVYYGAIGSYADGKPCWEELCYDTENKRWVDKETLDDIPYVNQEGIVIAWKEIVLPELPKESE